MLKSEREYLSREDVQKRAHAMLSCLFGDKADFARPAPLENILEKLINAGWIKFSHDAELGMLPGNRRIRGMFNVNPLSIHVCASLKAWDAEFRFVLAHEIGHLVLHRKLIGPGKFIDRKEVPADTYEQLKYRDKATMSDLGWVEWQANEFAACLVLPHLYLLKELSEKQINKGIVRNLGMLYFDDQPRNQIECAIIMAELAIKHSVTADLMRKRLARLGIFQDMRKKKVHAAYECLPRLF